MCALSAAFLLGLRTFFCVEDFLDETAILPWKPGALGLRRLRLSSREGSGQEFFAWVFIDRAAVGDFFLRQRRVKNAGRSRLEA